MYAVFQNLEGTQKYCTATKTGPIKEVLEHVLRLLIDTDYTLYRQLTLASWTKAQREQHPTIKQSFKQVPSIPLC